MPVTHVFVNPKADGADATVTRPSDWNAAHSGAPDLSPSDMSPPSTTIPSGSNIVLFGSLLIDTGVSVTLAGSSRMLIL